MSEEDEQFQRRWSFRRNDSDLGSSSDDCSGQSRATDLKLKKHMYPPDDEDDLQILNSPLSRPEAEIQLSHEEPDREPSRLPKKQARKAQTNKTNMNDTDPSEDSLADLRGFMRSMIEGVKVAREDLLKWMSSEMEMSFKEDTISKSPVAKKGKKRVVKETQNKNKSKTPRSNPTKARKKAASTSQNREDGSSEKSSKESKTSRDASEVVVPENEPAENTGIINTITEKNQKPKAKRSRLPSTKKQKVAASDQQPDKEPGPPTASVNASAPASDYLTLPSVLPRQEAESSERTNSEGADERDIRNRNAMTQASNLKSQPNFTPTFHQKDGVFAQTGLANCSDYEQNMAQNMVQTTGNLRGAGNGNRFPFALSSQGLTNGYGMPNIPNQFVPNHFGLQYMTQESMLSGLRMNGGQPMMPSGNHTYMESFGAYNQQLRFRAQGGIMNLHSPDINTKAGNLQPR